MWADFGSTSRYYLKFYQRSFMDFWDNLTPTQYGYILVGVAFAGWLMMKSANRK
ncbi:hypothetical protein [Planctomicrobium sp. SH664]|uniref:hypothetical protein n=1 Tax=Planctomicrobium sp. SH664 TaxID=3448125 RepID=UPI003F5B9AB3